MQCVFCGRRLSSSDQDHHHLLKDDELRAVWFKIFQRYLIPSSRHNKAFEVCKNESFCRLCRRTFHGIVRLQKEAAALEKSIERRIDILGKAVLAAGKVPLLRKNRMKSVQGRRVWRRFQQPVIQCK
jgi:hypothetical protein